MAIEKGFIKCPERHCSEVAEVWQADGKRAQKQSLYTKCPACGTNQGNGVARQKYLSENLKASIEELDIKVIEAAIDKRAASSDAQEKAAIPSKNKASSVSDDTATIPTKEPEQIPIDKAKDIPTAPPALLGVLALIAALITAIFAARKPTNKPKGQTA